MSAKSKAQGLINENAVVVFSKSYCPYCKSSKQTLRDLGAEFYALELDEIDDGREIQNALYEITSQSTVPNIFIGRKHIGGNSELRALRAKLPGLLREAGAL